MVYIVNLILRSVSFGVFSNSVFIPYLKSYGRLLLDYSISVERTWGLWAFIQNKSHLLSLFQFVLSYLKQRIFALKKAKQKITYNRNLNFYVGTGVFQSFPLFSCLFLFKVRLLTAFHGVFTAGYSPQKWDVTQVRKLLYSLLFQTYLQQFLATLVHK